MKPSTTLGILFMLAFCAIAPVMDAFAKATPEEVPVMQILAFRFGVQVILLVPMVWLMGLPLRFTPREALLHVARAAALIAGTFCFFSAVRHMPLADAIAIFFVSPFIVSLLGAVFLNEPIGWRRVAASVLGFVGALFVIRPSFAILGPVAMLPLGSAVCFAVYMLLTRTMSQRAHPLVVQAHTALAATLLTVPPILLADGSGIALLDPILPQGFALFTLLGVGTVATVSHVCLTFALRMAPAGLVSSLQYFEIVGATIVGWYAFGDFPTAMTLFGIAIIVASGLYTIARERRLEREAQRPLPPA